MGTKIITIIHHGKIDSQLKNRRKNQLADNARVSLVVLKKYGKNKTIGHFSKIND